MPSVTKHKEEPRRPLPNSVNTSLKDTQRQKSTNEDAFSRPPMRLINFDIMGHKFVVSSNALKKYPQTKLGRIGAAPDDPAARDLCHEYDPETQEFHFDALPSHFQTILRLYTSGTLHKPKEMCSVEFKALLAFWDINADNASICGKCSPILAISEKTTPKKEDFAGFVRLLKIKRAAWLVVDKTNTMTGKTFTLFSMLIVLLSFVMMVVDSYKNLAFADKCTMFIKANSFKDSEYGLLREAFCSVSNFCNMWFTAEFTIRALSCPNFISFCKGPLNWADFFAFAPWLMLNMFQVVGLDSASGRQGAQIVGIAKLLRLLKIIQVARLLKLSRRSRTILILYESIKQAAQSFALMAISVTFFAAFFATAMYYAELTAEPLNPEYNSIPSSAWHSIVDYFGYMNFKPSSSMGQVISAFGAIFGIVVMAFPIGLILEEIMSAFKKMSEDD